MQLFLVTLVVFLVAMGLLSLRILLVPGGEFRGTCSTNNEFNRRHGGECPSCGRKADEPCPNQDRHPG